VTAPTPEELEKARQGIMRMRELLDILHERAEEGERAYQRFFAGLSPEDTAGLKEKEVQRLAAYAIVDDRSRIMTPALSMSFTLRELGREFEQIHDNFVEVEAAE
jgi:hypothetical protein